MQYIPFHQFQFNNSSSITQKHFIKNKIMNQSLYSPKKSSKKQKYSIFRQFVQPQKLQIKKLLARLSQSHEINQQKNIKDILENRQRKLTQLRNIKNKYIWQNSIIVATPRDKFSNELPISTGQKYLLQKVRQNIIAPDKMYNKQPNIRVGSVDESKMTNFIKNDDPQVISKKFQQYVRILNQQSGAIKRKKYSQGETIKSDNQSLPVINSTYKITMKKTYFKKYPSDQYNFYKPPITDISRAQKITSQRQSTQFSRSKSRQFQKSRDSSPRNYNTLQISLNSNRQKIANINSTREKSSNQKLYFNNGMKTLDGYRNI